MLGNLVTSLFRHERIQTTVAKGKELRSVADKLVTLAKRGDLHSRRVAAVIVKDAEILRKLFSEIGPRMANRAGGYTRFLHAGKRQGDNAPLAFVELVDAAEARVEQVTIPAADESAGAEATAP
jgi:large subunit ribosomal protein L17